MMRRSAAAWIPILALAPAGYPGAHHSVPGNFDRDAPIELQATVREVQIQNPHSRYIVDVVGDDGEAEEWLIEWADRNALTRRQVDLDLIEVGDEITITVWPSYRLGNVGYFVQAILPDGSLYRDCGFAEFRQAVRDSEEFSCEDASPERTDR